MLRFEIYILVMYCEICGMATLEIFIYLLMRCYDIIPLRCFEKLIMHVWTYRRSSI